MALPPLTTETGMRPLGHMVLVSGALIDQERLLMLEARVRALATRVELRWGKSPLPVLEGRTPSVIASEFADVLKAHITTLSGGSLDIQGLTDAERQGESAVMVLGIAWPLRWAVEVIQAAIDADRKTR